MGSSNTGLTHSSTYASESGGSTSDTTQNPNDDDLCPFSVGEKVLAFHGDFFYEAKVNFSLSFKHFFFFFILLCNLIFIMLIHTIFFFFLQGVTNCVLPEQMGVLCPLHRKYLLTYVLFGYLKIVYCDLYLSFLFSFFQLIF